MNPAHLTPMIEAKGLPKGVLWESCAIMQYLCNKHDITKFYPKNLAKRAMIDSAMFYLIGTFTRWSLAPPIRRSAFGQYAGEVGSSDLDAAAKAQGRAQKAADDAIAEPLDVFHKFYHGRTPFIGGAKPSIADIRLAATLEFLAMVDYQLPGWAKTYMAAHGKDHSARPTPNPPPTSAATSPM